MKKRLVLKREVKEKIKEELVFLAYMIPMWIFEWHLLLKIFFK